MGRIKVLSPEVVDKIAAGEVIERPASVVKELVENSIDANASTIRVLFSEGGRKSIKVIDNGAGMDANDLKLSIKSHATSKINNIEDLLQLNSLGFRGEALSSIVSVSRTKIISRPHELDKGHLIFIEGGKITDFQPAGAPPGTSIEVNDLFFNTPARLKYLKGKNREASNIIWTLISLALASPAISFQAKHNDRGVLQTSGRGDILRTWGEIYGPDKCMDMLKIPGVEESYFTISGFLGKPNLALSTTRGVHLFINNRPFYSRPILNAVLEGCREYFPRGKFPQIILFIKINPVHVDVNVHPAKREVKLSEQEIITKIITEASQEVLQKEIGQYKPAVENEKNGFSLPQLLREKESPQQGKTPQAEKQKIFPEAPSQKTDFLQIGSSFIVTRSSQGLMIIDQHGAHERLNYNKLLSQLRDNPRDTSRTLLTPLTIELSPAEVELKEEIIAYLKKLNFRVENFGPNSLLLRAVPQCVNPKKDPLPLCHELLQQFVEDFGKDNLSQIEKEAIITIACHDAVKAGDSLSPEEMEHLLSALFSHPENTTCPHGRPIIKELTLKELGKFFGRQV